MTLILSPSNIVPMAEIFIALVNHVSAVCKERLDIFRTVVRTCRIGVTERR